MIYMKKTLLFIITTIILLLPAIQAKPISGWSKVHAPADTTVFNALTIAGNYIYATGYVQNGGTGTDILVVKADLDGNIVWSKTYDNFNFEYGSHIDFYNGKVYVYGLGKTSDGEISVQLLCLDENGNQQWIRVWGKNGLADYPEGLAVGSQGIFIAVTSVDTNAGTSEYWIIKYSLDGYVQKYVNGPGSNDIAHDLKLHDNKVYVVGSSDSDGFIAIYDDNLNSLLFKKYSTLPGYMGVDKFDKIVLDKVDEGLAIIVLIQDSSQEASVAVLIDKDYEVRKYTLVNLYLSDAAIHYHILTAVGYKTTDAGDKNFALYRWDFVWDLEEFDMIKTWGGSGDDAMTGVAVKYNYIIMSGYSESYTSGIAGILWMYDSKHQLKVNMPSSEFQWMVFYPDFALPVAGAKGSGTASLPETLYFLKVTEEVTEDDVKMVFSRWSDGVTDNPRNITLVEDMELTAIYDTYYKIEVESQYGQASGTGFYKAGSKATISVTPVQVPLSGGKYAVFKGWEKDGEIVSQEPTTQVVVNEPAKYKAVWEVKSGTPPSGTYTVHVETMYGTATGSGTYSEGEYVTVSVSPTVVEHGNMTRHVFKGWRVGDQIVSTSATYTFKVTGDVSVEAVWETQYYVRVVSQIGQTSGSGWYPRGSQATVSVSPDSTGEHVFKGWQTGGEIISTENPYTFMVTEPLVLEAVWSGAPPPSSGQYSVIVESEYGKVEGSGQYSAGEIVVIKVEPSVIEQDGSRKIFVKWVYEDGKTASSSPSFRITVTEDIKLKAVWATEYLVKVETDIGSVEGGGWYREGSYASVRVSSLEVTVGGEKYKFKGWADETGNIVSTDPRYSFKVTGPVYLKAVWEKAGVVGGQGLGIPIEVLIGVVAVIVALVILLVVTRVMGKRR